MLPYSFFPDLGTFYNNPSAMYIQADLRAMVHIVTSTETSVIAAPKTKLNMPKFTSIQTEKAIYLCASHDIARNANESLIASLISLFLCPNCRGIVPSYTGLRIPRVPQDGGRAWCVPSGQDWQKTQSEERLGWNCSWRNPTEDPKPCASLCLQAGMQLQQAQTAACRTTPCPQPSPSAGAGAVFPLGSSRIPRVPRRGKQSHFRAALAAAAEGASDGNALRSSPGRATRLPRPGVAKKITI